MRNDPIVEEIHAIRRQILAEHGGDLNRYLDYLREREAEHPERMVSRVEQPLGRREPEVGPRYNGPVFTPPKQRGWQDDLIEKMPSGVDESQILENLKLTPTERLEKALSFRRQVEEMREAFAKRPAKAG